jgi:tetratricopeptide (TPR) repeat protein
MKTGISILFIVSLFMVVSCSLTSNKIRHARILYEEAQLLSNQGRTNKALAKFEKSLALAKEVEFQAGAAHNLNEMAIIYSSKGDQAGARQFLNEALEIYKELEMNPEVSKCLNNIAISYTRERNFPETLKTYEELLEWDRATHNDLGAGITLNNMGLILEGHFDNQKQAREYYLEALEIFESLGKEKHIQAVKKNLGEM